FFCSVSYVFTPIHRHQCYPRHLHLCTSLKIYILPILTSKSLVRWKCCFFIGSVSGSVYWCVGYISRIIYSYSYIPSEVSKCIIPTSSPTTSTCGWSVCRPPLVYYITEQWLILLY